MSRTLLMIEANDLLYAATPVTLPTGQKAIVLARRDGTEALVVVATGVGLECTCGRKNCCHVRAVKKATKGGGAKKPQEPEQQPAAEATVEQAKQIPVGRYVGVVEEEAEVVKPMKALAVASKSVAVASKVVAVATVDQIGKVWNRCFG